jgi:hypothetical protein
VTRIHQLLSATYEKNFVLGSGGGVGGDVEVRPSVVVGIRGSTDLLSEDCSARTLLLTVSIKYVLIIIKLQKNYGTTLAQCGNYVDFNSVAFHSYRSGTRPTAVYVQQQIKAARRTIILHFDSLFITYLSDARIFRTMITQTMGT